MTKPISPVVAMFIGIILTVGFGLLINWIIRFLGGVIHTISYRAYGRFSQGFLDLWVSAITCRNRIKCHLFWDWYDTGVLFAAVSIIVITAATFLSLLAWAYFYA